MFEKISSEDFIKAFGAGVKQQDNIKLITNEDIRWTDKIFLDSKNKIRDFNGNIVGIYGSFGGKNEDL